MFVVQARFFVNTDTPEDAKTLIERLVQSRELDEVWVECEYQDE